MPIFYILHSIFNELNVNENGDVTEHGKRNCKLFLLGSFIYVCIFVYLMHLKVKYPNSLMNETYRWALIYLCVADLLVMAYIYKSYFGRNILHELSENSEFNFDYDKDTHKYTKSKNKKLIEESLKILKKNNTSMELYTGKTCSICLEDFDLEKDNLVALKCGHVFHEACKNEFSGTKKCPICRKPFND